MLHAVASRAMRSQYGSPRSGLRLVDAAAHVRGDGAEHPRGAARRCGRSPSDSGIERLPGAICRSVSAFVSRSESTGIRSMVFGDPGWQIDGFEHRSKPSDRRRDMRADARLALRGYTVLRFDYQQVLLDSNHVIATAAAIRRAPTSGSRGSTAVGEDMGDAEQVEWQLGLGSGLADSAIASIAHGMPSAAESVLARRCAPPRICPTAEESVDHTAMSPNSVTAGARR